MRLRNIKTLVLAASLGFCASSIAAQQPGVFLDTGGQDWIQSDAEIEVVLDQPLADGRLAILLGQEDRTDLFRRTERGLAYRAGELPLPAGETDLVVFLVDSGENWNEIGRFPLRVLSPRGYTRRELGARADVDVHGPVDDNKGGGAEAKGFTGFGDDEPDIVGDVQVQLSSQLAKQSWELAAEINLVGVSEEAEALRFAFEGDDAPRVDLASFNVRMSNTRGEVEVGHTMYGTSRHLIDGFSSRGLRGRYQLGSRANASVAALNGTEVVGWDNPFGLASSSHQILAAGIEMEAVAQRPGALTVGLTVLDGSVEPLDDFNQGSVNDAEESDGWNVSLRAASPSGRVSAAGSFTRSNFRNPEDEFLAQGANLVAVAEEERDARYFELGLDLVRDRQVRNRPVSLRMTLTHDRVDPLFRSVAAFTRSDVEENRAALDFGLGAFSAQLQHTRSEDNLDDVPSILTTKTEVDTFNVLVPFAQLSATAAKPAALPTFSYSFNRFHQYADALPVNGGFSAGHLPDQVSDTQQAGLEWQGAAWQAGFRFNETSQDNRQPGRETADFRTTIRTVFYNHALSQQLDLGGEISAEELVSLATGRRELTDRIGVNWGWRPSSRFSWIGNLSWTEQEDRESGSESSSLVIDSEWAYRFLERATERHGANGQVYLRYSNEDSDLEDRLFGFFESRRVWSIVSGVSLSFY